MTFDTYGELCSELRHIDTNSLYSFLKDNKMDIIVEMVGEDTLIEKHYDYLVGLYESAQESGYRGPFRGELPDYDDDEEAFHDDIYLFYPQLEDAIDYLIELVPKYKDVIRRLRNYQEEATAEDDKMEEEIRNNFSTSGYANDFLIYLWEVITDA